MNIDYPLKDSLIYRRKAINALAGDGAIYSDSFDGITNWRSDPSKQPTEEAIQAKLAELQADYDSKQYQRDREFKYPTIQEQLDMQYWDSVNGTTKWKDAIAKVKTDNPKPSE
tara:strand:+ start:672 stop:1010 length:339 start_codon:yes stop_codon:yes gene_type:complete